MDTKKPDFIIAGTMKSGTTWLHHALNDLPGIYLPEEEIHLFDCWDPVVHPDMQHVSHEGLTLLDGSDTTWFDLQLSIQGKESLVGYDSTTLFHSNIDFQKLSKDYPELKIVVIFRNPVDRAFSHYWHLLRTGRVYRTFEKEILFGRGEIVARSVYLEKALKIRSAFGGRCRFICYEDMFKNPEKILGDLLHFLEIDMDFLSVLMSRTKAVSNPGRFPVFESGWRFAAWLLQGLEHGRYAKNLKKVGPARAKVRFFSFRLKQVLMIMCSFGVMKKKPKMKKLTRRSLEKYFSEANRGLGDVVDFDIQKHWFE